MTSRRPLASEPVTGVPEPDEDPADEAAPAGTRAADDAPEVPRNRPTTVDQTKDDTDEDWGEPADGDASAQWLRENRPPHWG